MLAELTYQPPRPPEFSLEPSCARHGRHNSMDSPTAPPRPLDTFSNHNFSAVSDFTSMTLELGWPTPGATTQGQPVADATHSSAGFTSRNPLIYFQCEGRAATEASAQVDHALAAGEAIEPGDGERIPIAGPHFTVPAIHLLYAGLGKPTAAPKWAMACIQEQPGSSMTGVLAFVSTSHHGTSIATETTSTATVNKHDQQAWPRKTFGKAAQSPKRQSRNLSGSGN
ncbi:hypothetical protein HPB51_017772 [Rhipicephalus microplus]|uniref:Uncharacterized protein n=1 Tax=Rhipicephalus microplus TaxID=6941 RepID=A0A9J6EAF0_RHIMP|nr:hypothetical protein HPB51_017772 [Rhipicephalus microplus]